MVLCLIVLILDDGFGPDLPAYCDDSMYQLQSKMK
jgi:hypothetical protein